MKILVTWFLTAACALASSFEVVELIDKQQPITGGYRTAKISPMRELIAQEPIRLVGSIFPDYTVDTNFWTTNVTAAGVVTGVVGEVELRTATNVNSTTQFQSMRSARYIAGSANFYRGVHRIQTPLSTASNAMVWGAFNTNQGHGCGFMYSNATFYAFTEKSTVRTLTPASSFTTAFNIDTNSHTYEIWWSNSSVWWLIDDVLRYKGTYSYEPWCGQGGKKITIQNFSYGGGTNTATLCVRAASIYSFGHNISEAHYRHLTGANTFHLKSAQGRLHRVVVNKAGTLCTVYDSATTAGAVSGTEIAVIDTDKTTGGVGDYSYDVPFYNGLVVITTGGGTDITVIYE